MKLYQLFKIIDAASLGMSKEEGRIILETFLESDKELDRILDFDDDNLRKRKSHGHNEYTTCDRFISLFSQKYLHHSSEEEKFDEYIRFRKKLRLRCRVPFVLFDTIVKDIHLRYHVRPTDCKGR